MMQQEEIRSLRAEIDRLRSYNEGMSKIQVEMEATIERLRAATERVCWFDWSGNDDDAVRAIADLRELLPAVEQSKDPTP